MSKLGSSKHDVAHFISQDVLLAFEQDSPYQNPDISSIFSATPSYPAKIHPSALIICSRSEQYQPYLKIAMTGRSHDVDIELFNGNGSPDDEGEGSYTTRNDLRCQSSDEDSEDDFQSCSESLASRDSIDEDRDQGHQKSLKGGGNETKAESSFVGPKRGKEGGNNNKRSTSMSRLSHSRSRSRDGKGQVIRKGSMDNIRAAKNATPPPRPSITIQHPSSETLDFTSDVTSQDSYKDFYAAGLKAIREIDSDSARSPTIATSTTPSVKTKSLVSGSVSLLDRFGRKILLPFDQDEEMHEVRVDEDCNYYVYGDEGLRVKLKEGQVVNEDNSSPVCISGGKRIPITIIPDRFRTSALQDPKPVSDIADEPIAPRTERGVSSKSIPLLPPVPKVSEIPIPNTTTPRNTKIATQAPKKRPSRNPWAGVFTGVAAKSKEATTYLSKGARSRKRSTSVQTAPELETVSTLAPEALRTSIRTLSSGKGGLDIGETAQGRGFGFGKSPRRHSGGSKVVTFGKRILGRRD